MTRNRLAWCVLLLLGSLGAAQAASVTCTWSAPTTNADGTPLTDLAGFHVYYGQASRAYVPPIDVGNVTTFMVPNLSTGQTYYFAVTAYDWSGNESPWSNELSVTILPPDPVLPVQTVTASAWQAPNVPANTLDGDLNTRWSAEGIGQWIAYDLGAQQTVSQVAIAWYLALQQRTTFTIEVSLDSVLWMEVYRGRSSGTTLALEAYAFAAVPARYVRIVGYGTNVNRWNSITEVQIHGLVIQVDTLAPTNPVLDKALL